MRKLGFSLFSCMALVAFMGLSGTALAAVDPSCDGDPYDNTPAIHDFTISTLNDQAGAVSGLTGSGLACGSDSTNVSTYNDNADVTVAPGVEINNTSGIANDRFVGTATVNVASNVAGVVQNLNSIMSVKPLSECALETPVGGIPGTIIACYKGSNALGTNYNWATDDGSGNLTLTIGPFHPLFGSAGLTHIKAFNLCGNAGASGGQVYPTDCGTSADPFLQKNGDASEGGFVSIRKPGGIKSAPPIAVRRIPDCFKGTGTYSVTATTKGPTPPSITTDPASTCVEWQ